MMFACPWRNELPAGASACKQYVCPQGCGQQEAVAALGRGPSRRDRRQCSSSCPCRADPGLHQRRPRERQQPRCAAGPYSALTRLPASQSVCQGAACGLQTIEPGSRAACGQTAACCAGACPAAVKDHGCASRGRAAGGRRGCLRCRGLQDLRCAWLQHGAPSGCTAQ